MRLPSETRNSALLVVCLLLVCVNVVVTRSNYIHGPYVVLGRCNANVVSVRYRQIGENKQQDKMTNAQIFIPTTNIQFQRCVNKSYRKWLGMLSPGSADRFSKGGDLELLNRVRNVGLAMLVLCSNPELV